MCIFYYSVKLFAIVWTCEATKNEALRTGNLIHEMLIDTADFDVKYELQTFSLQLLHSNNTFDAKGTVIDARLLKGIFGGVATHLFILIQFLLSSKK
ncbi:putative gustatory receptor 28b isoform X2 [Cephus cinctus]|nr:putative gustatory receptor 28b isoform X2 [Cephus cinctus]